SLHGNTVKTIAVDKVMVKMNYRKKKKEVYQLMELVSLFEQLTGEKPLIKINESTEKNNVVKLEDFQLTVRLQKQKALFFINALCYVGLGERKHFTLKESNNIDLEALTLNYRYKNLKIFRPLLVRKDMNLEAKIAIEMRYKPIGINKERREQYKQAEQMKNMYKMLRRNELLDQETRNYFNMQLTRLLAKATCVTVNGSKRVFEVLSVFENEGLIRGFQIIDIKTNKVSIYLKYKQDMTSLLSRIKAVSVNKEKLYLKGKVLTKFYPRVNLYFIESKFGLKTLPQLQLRNKIQNKSLNTFEIEYKIANKAVQIKSSGKMGVITKELKLKESVIQANNIYYLKNHGDSRIIIGTMKQQIQGVLAGFCIELKLVGLGYVVHKVGNTLVLDVGYSHYRSCVIPEDVVVKLEGSQIILYSINKEKVTTFASLLKTFKKVNMYKGTGILGINLNVAQKVIMLSGNVASLKGNTLLKSQEKQILEILQSFKGLYDYTYGLKVEALDKIRRLENVYRYIRVIKGYPIKGRTKSNANTAKRQSTPGGNKKVKIMDILKKKPTNRKERRIFNKIKKLQDKHNKQQQKNKKKYKFPLYLLGKLWLYKFIRRKFNLIGPLNEQF
ncbi:hypothetical protein ACTFIV_006909, partial [Dictyostelium citrinum]